MNKKEQKMKSIIPPSSSNSIDQSNINLLLTHLNLLIQLKSKENIAASKALTYISITKRQKKALTLSKLIPFYEQYYSALNSHTPLTLSELVKPFNINECTATRLLDKVGLTTLTPKRTRLTLNNEQKLAIERAKTIPLGFKDVAYYLGCSSYCTYIRLKKINLPPRFSNIPARFLSKIYEANDLGFVTEEIQYLLSLRKHIVVNSLKTRNSLEPSLIESLQKLYDLPKINTPYLSIELEPKWLSDVKSARR